MDNDDNSKDEVLHRREDLLEVHFIIILLVYLLLKVEHNYFNFCFVA